MSAINCSHQDPSRSAVGSTAQLVAAGRGIESGRQLNPLLYDPFADVLSGSAGREILQSSNFVGGDADDLINLIAVRTREIDDILIKDILSERYPQVCVLGAGLDTRPWRLAMQTQSLSDNESIRTFMESFKRTHWFEVDFKEVFDYKLPKIQPDSDEMTCGNIHSVACDLSLPTWPQILKEDGFRTDLRTIWLLEGLVGYLTEDEVATLLGTITILSAVQSKLIATFIGNDVKLSSGLHRSRCDDPLKLLEPLGWIGSRQSFVNIAQSYNRPLSSNYNGYCLVNVELTT